ncbi:MAG TPA: hypothetical protein VK674_01675 [Candidatus Limnocylindria bacterium]|nr:hypothetical protein [Candidatus Limnocylindria bacterium]
MDQLPHPAEIKLIPLADIVQDYPGILSRHGIPLDRWGVGATKTTDDLLGELEAGESTLVVGPDGLRRHTTIASIEVLYTDEEGRNYRLQEDRQEFTNGVRQRNLPRSIGEKMPSGEAPLAAFRRALAEELKLQPHTLIYSGTETSSTVSESYPGLPTDVTAHLATASIAPGDYNPDGYQEVQPTKTTYFVWQEVPA